MFFDPNFCKMSRINFSSVYVLYLEMRFNNMSIVHDSIGSLYHLKFLRLSGICHSSLFHWQPQESTNTCCCQCRHILL